MNDTAILFPVMLQVWLTLILLLKLGRIRLAAVRSGAVQMQDIALSGDDWPDDVKKVSNCVLNQFQTPVLFYLLCILLLATHLVDIWYLVLAWVFVFSRLVHAFIHTGSNIVRHRAVSYLVGALALIAMWGYFTLSFLLKSL